MESNVEILYHFTCERCKNWWSIAMEKNGWNPKKMWCPHCGYEHNDEQVIINYAWTQK